MFKNHTHSNCMNTAMKRAETLCNQRNIRFTPIRKKILALILEQHMPIKAYDILAKLSDADHIEKPPTVYRALEFLLENQLIHKIDSINSYIGCEFAHKQHQSQFLVCDSCNEVMELQEPLLNSALTETSQSKGFVVRQSHVEIHGVCADCAN
jgi:Fur family zinc uptake transcriptional regulator